MYKTLLILKYLRKRRIAWVSLLAVTLCTTMVIVVMSVMSGWLAMFKESSRGLTGDIVIQRRGLTGFGDYDKIVAELEKLPEVAAAVPTIETFGLVNIADKIRSGVQVIGLPIDKIGKVNRFPQSLYRQHLSATDPNASDEEREAGKVLTTQPPSFDLPLEADYYRMRKPPIIDPRTKKPLDLKPETWTGMIVGAGVVGVRPEIDGTIDWNLRAALGASAKLTVLGVNDVSDINLQDANSDNFWLVDLSRTKVFEQDNQTVYVPFAKLQELLRMQADEYTDADTGKKVTQSARTTNIQIALKPGHEPLEFVAQVQAVVDRVLGQDADTFEFDRVSALGWETLRADFINAIEREIVLTTLLFGIISVVAVFLIFCIFYMIVAEKTKDIGIIKSVGATGGGVASIFLGYGLAIGVIGGGLGLLFSYLIVRNINEIHTWMGKRLGVEMWNAKTYMFDKIPDTLDPFKVSMIVAVAVLSSVAGSIIPAIRAARMNPVEALRWE